MRFLTIVIFAALATPADAGTRIVHGAPAEVPYAVSLVETGYPEPDGHFCGGSVIAPTRVLTAAHCVEGETARSISVVSGRTRLSDTGTGQRTRVASIAVDPRWDGTGHDAALLTLAAPISAPAVPVSAGGAAEQPGARSVVAGWGLTSTDGDISDVLRSTALPVSSTAACRREYGSAFDPATMICAGGEGPDSCQGDSGGPLVGADGTLIGLVSFGGERCGERGVPGVYTRASAELDWLSGAVVAPAAHVRFGRIDCGPRRCRFSLTTRGAIGAIRVRGGGYEAYAWPTSPGRWAVRLPLRDGRSAISATPLTADGVRAGRTTTVRIEIRRRRGGAVPPGATRAS
jgi:trypsin